MFDLPTQYPRQERQLLELSPSFSPYVTLHSSAQPARQPRPGPTIRLCAPDPPKRRQLRFESRPGPVRSGHRLNPRRPPRAEPGPTGKAPIPLRLGPSSDPQARGISSAARLPRGQLGPSPELQVARVTVTAGSTRHGDSHGPRPSQRHSVVRVTVPVDHHDGGPATSGWTGVPLAAAVPDSCGGAARAGGQNQCARGRRPGPALRPVSLQAHWHCD